MRDPDAAHISLIAPDGYQYVNRQGRIRSHDRQKPRLHHVYGPIVPDLKSQTLSSMYMKYR